jgi:hypothetical protein
MYICISGPAKTLTRSVRLRYFYTHIHTHLHISRPKLHHKTSDFASHSIVRMYTRIHTHIHMCRPSVRLCSPLNRMYTHTHIHTHIHVGRPRLLLEAPPRRPLDSLTRCLCLQMIPCGVYTGTPCILYECIRARSDYVHERCAHTRSSMGIYAFVCVCPLFCLHACIHTCVYLCMPACMCVYCVCVHSSVYACIHTHVCPPVCLSVCMRSFLCSSMHSSIHITKEHDGLQFAVMKTMPHDFRPHGHMQ